MSANLVFPCALVAILLGIGTARAQVPGQSPPPAVTGATGDMPLIPSIGSPEEPQPQPTAKNWPLQLSPWMTHTCIDCCGPLGGDSPVTYDLFLRVGPAIPTGGGVFWETMKTGFAVEGGGRSLFFNPARDRAWAVSISLSNVYNHGQRPDLRFPLNILVPNFNNVPTRVDTEVWIRNLNRTYFNVGLGRDWYFGGGSTGPGPYFRVGAEGGGRYGTASLEFHNLRHRTDVIYGLFAAGHADVEIPCGGCTFQAGFRVEWDYTWMDILQKNQTDLSTVNLLFSTGVRF